MCRAPRLPLARHGRSPAARRLLAAASVAALAGNVLANPTVQLGNYVASRQAGGSVVITVVVIDPSVVDLNSARNEDIEGMNFTVQLGAGTGSLPSIGSVDLSTNTVWTGNIDPPFGGVDAAAGNSAQFKSYSVSTTFNPGNVPPGTVINPNGVLARVTLSTDGAALGQTAVKLVNTKDPTRETQFVDGLGNTVASTITNGTLTVINNTVIYWTGASSNAWDAGSNWTGSAKPTSAQDAYFGKPIPGTGSTLSLTAPDAANNLWFDANYTFTGGQINLGDAGSGGGVNVFAGSAVVLNSAVGGSQGLTLAGGGNLTLGGATNNVYAGNTNVNAGTLFLAKIGGAVAIPGGALNVNAATAQFDAANQTSDQTAVVLNGATASMVVNASQTVGSLTGDGTVAFPALPGPSLSVGSNDALASFAGSITGAGNLIKAGSNTFSLTGSSLSVSSVTVNGGTLAFANVAPNLVGNTLGGSWTVNNGTLTLPPAASVTTIGPTGSVTLGAPAASFVAINGLTSNQGTFNVSGGKVFSTASSLTNDGTVGVTGSGSSLSVTGGLTNTGTPGATGSTTVGAGATLAANLVKQNSLTVGGIASIRPLASGGALSTLNNLSIAGNTNAWSGKLDLADNGLVLNYSGGSPKGTIRNQLSTARTANGSWSGNGITSTKASATQYGLGFAEATDLYAAGGKFWGQNIPAGQNAILIHWTLYGDLNLDGVVNGTDLNTFGANFGKSADRWSLGDLNYDGVVNGTDLNLFGGQFGHALPTLPPPVITPADQLAFRRLVSSVPEPSSAALLGFAGAGLLRRRKRAEG